ncbi:MAG: TraR/DksA C4-type zinc finger protein [Nitrospiraceae bacterium]|nr:TraR/DksA C4-type zinc finger protein [Nitrospiraceae bacterium]
MSPKKDKLLSKEKNGNSGQDSAERELSPREEKIQGIKNNLLRQKESILSEAEVAMNALPEQTVFPDLGDQASAEMDRSFMLRLRGREQRLLKKIEEAIERIDSGSFGICEICGEPIDIKRLQARPVTTMCIACKTEQEEEEKLQGGH